MTARPAPVVDRHEPRRPRDRRAIRRSRRRSTAAKLASRQAALAKVSATTGRPLGHSHRSRDNPPLGEGRLASDLASRVMSPGKHPPEGAQSGTLTPAIGRATAAHGAHALDETPYHGEEQMQAQDPPNHPPHHVTSSLSEGSPSLLSMDPTGMHWMSHSFVRSRPTSALAVAADIYNAAPISALLRPGEFDQHLDFVGMSASPAALAWWWNRMS